jgi:hypothetical protein
MNIQCIKKQMVNVAHSQLETFLKPHQLIKAKVQAKPTWLNIILRNASNEGENMASCRLKQMSRIIHYVLHENILKCLVTWKLTTRGLQHAKITRLIIDLLPIKDFISYLPLVFLNLKYTNVPHTVCIKMSLP